MNRFQTQLVMADGKTLAEKDGRFKPLPPRKCSIEDFEKDMKPDRLSRRKRSRK